MNKSQLNKILIILLVIIWSVLLYNYVFPYFKNNESNLLVVDIPSSVSYNSFAKDTFELKLDDRDPFLNRLVVKTKKPVSKPIIKARKKEVIKNTVWPRVEYLGFVKSNEHKSRLGLVRVDSKLYKVHDGEKLEVLNIIKIEEDSIRVNFNGVNKYFPRL